MRPLQLGRMLHNWGDCTPIVSYASGGGCSASHGFSLYLVYFDSRDTWYFYFVPYVDLRLGCYTCFGTMMFYYYVVYFIILHVDGILRWQYIYDVIWLYGLLDIIIDYVRRWILCYGYLLHFCIFTLSTNMSEVNGLNRYFNTCCFNYDIICNCTWSYILVCMNYIPGSGTWS